jgi:DNA (cytosine-5)-methyltransferase 1
MPTLPHLTGLNCPGAQMVGVLAVNISGGVGRLESVMGTLDADGASTTAIGAQTRGVVLTYDARGNGQGVVANALTGDHQNRVTDYTAIVLRNREGKPGGGKGPLLSEGKSLTLGTSNDQVVFTRQRSDEYAVQNVASTIAQRDYKSASDIVAGNVGVPRRLTPVECERLMGWPDQHTAHGINEKGTAYALADTARYKLCGNGIASPVTAWIGFQMARLLTSDK